MQKKHQFSNRAYKTQVDSTPELLTIRGLVFLTLRLIRLPPELWFPSTL